MLDPLTAATAAFLPCHLQRLLLDSVRRRSSADAPPTHDADWLLQIVRRARADDAAARTLITRARQQAETALEAAARAGIDSILWGHPDYPPLLAEIAQPPFLLWRLGHAAPLHAPCLAIVGSRAASAYGLEVATRLAVDLSCAGLTIVSGLARGADSAAHRGALAQGRTAALLGSGADIIYPPEHARLAQEIVTRGGVLLSEFAPGTPPRRDHFPRRNRLISGLSLGVLVIEASERSGSLQTARCAAEQGREVLAVPGSVLGERNRGAHALLRDGATLVERAADVLIALRLPDLPAALNGTSADGVDGTDEAGARGPGRRALTILDAMGEGEVYDVQALVSATGLPAEALLRALLLLELEGRVVRSGDGRFLRAGRPVIR